MTERTVPPEQDRPFRTPDPQPEWERITPTTDRPLREEHPPGIAPPSPWPEDSEPADQAE